MSIRTDSPRSWLVAIGCCWINLFSAIAYKSSGVIYVGVLQTFDVSREEASWPLTLLAVFIFATGPLAGILALYFSIWQISLCGCLLSSIAVCACFYATGTTYLMLCLGALQGVGLGLLTLHNVIINQHFRKHRATASGISYAGPTLASLLFPPLVQVLFNHFGLRGALLLFGAIMLNSVVGAFLQRPPSALRNARSSCNRYRVVASSRGDEPLNKNDVSVSFSNGRVQNGDVKVVYETLKDTEKTKLDENGEADVFLNSGQEQKVSKTKDIAALQDSLTFFKNPMFYVVSLSFAVILFNLTTYLTVVVDFAVDHNVPHFRAVLLISSYSIADLAARLGSGWLSDRGFVSRGNMMAIHFLMGGIVMFGMPFLTSYPGQVALSVFSGWANGCNMILVSVLLTEHVGLDQLPVSFGATSLVAGLLCLARPPLIGYFRDTTGDYEGLFRLIGGVSVVLSGVWFGAAAILKCNATKKQQSQP
ncbi:monocarboxylate transporter 12-like [Ornithodoros turicata]|uniref:monocarboxylate transporter 12-like n=1 Tax=Ornithodoros turicata TaxID=34597 RepID=UPI00313A1E7E